MESASTLSQNQDRERGRRMREQAACPSGLSGHMITNLQSKKGVPQMIDEHKLKIMEQYHFYMGYGSIITWNLRFIKEINGIICIMI